MSKYRPNYAIQLGNQLFASILNAPRVELLDVEIASDHDIELELVHRTLDRYVTSGWLDMQPKPRPLGKPLRLYTVAAGYNDRVLLPAEAPLKQAEPVSPAGAKRKPVLPVEPVAPAALVALHKPAEVAAAPVVPIAPPSEAAPSDRPPVEAVKSQQPPAAKPAASKEEIIMPRGVYPRDPSAPKAEKKQSVSTSHAFSCALFDDDRLVIRAGGKAVELTPEETSKLVAYLRRIGAVYETAAPTLASEGVNIDRANRKAA